MHPNNIMKLRRSKGITRKQLADTLGWKVRRLESYERGERGMRIPEIAMIAKALDTDITTLLDIHIK